MADTGAIKFACCETWRTIEGWNYTLIFVVWTVFVIFQSFIGKWTP
jgi:hypothetical protein